MVPIPIAKNDGGAAGGFGPSAVVWPNAFRSVGSDLLGAGVEVDAVHNLRCGLSILCNVDQREAVRF